jgi:hypothetical protein
LLLSLRAVVRVPRVYKEGEMTDPNEQPQADAARLDAEEVRDLEMPAAEAEDVRAGMGCQGCASKGFVLFGKQIT